MYVHVSSVRYVSGITPEVSVSYTSHRSYVAGIVDEQRLSLSLLCSMCPGDPICIYAHRSAWMGWKCSLQVIPDDNGTFWTQQNLPVGPRNIDAE
jgi:hypothetical protein